MRYCFACGRKLKPDPNVAVTSDGQIVDVGTECYKRITPEGFKPEKGGPVLYRGRFAQDGKLIEVIRK